MRILYVVSLFPCWSETFIVREIQALIERGADVRILSLRHSSEALVQSDAASLIPRTSYPPRGIAAACVAAARVVRSPAPARAVLFGIARGLSRRPEALLKSLVVWWRTLAAVAAIEAWAPDHIHAHWCTYPSTAALLLARTLGLPFSFTAHAHDLFIEDHLLEDKLRAAAFAVTISEYNLAHIERRFGPAAAAKLKIVRCGLSLSDFEFKEDGREPGVILAVGRLDEVKGFATLVEACARLRERGRPFRCEIVGEGPLRTALERRVRALDLSGLVKLPGAMRIEAIKERLLRAAVFALPSEVAVNGNRDGIPVSLMEAMASGLPVVSTRVSGIPELIRSGWNGLLAEPGDASRIADHLESVLADPGLGRRLARNARRSIEHGFDVALESERLLGLFAQAVGG